MYFNDTPTQSEEGADFITTPVNIAIAASIIDTILILFGATLNLPVIITIARHHRSLKIMDIFILNLCLSDFISSIFYQPLVITRLLARNQPSRIHTKIFKMATFTCLLADCAALFLVTFDKYLGIRYPFRYHTYFNKQKVVAIIVCAWITALAIGLTFAFFEQASKIAGILYATLILIMFVITASLQIASLFIAKGHEIRIRQMGEAVQYNSTAGGCKIADGTDPRRDDRESAVVQRSTSNAGPVHPFTSKAAKTITLLTMVFIMSWLPQIVLNMYYVATFDKATFFSFIYLFVAFQQVHVCINPFVYVFRTQSIRDKFFARTREEVGVPSGR